MPRLLRGFFDRVQRVGKDRLGVVEQAADQRALAVIDAAAGEEAQQAVVDRAAELGNVFDRTHQKYPSFLRCSIAASEA
jgi:hypothetical protein